MANAFDSGRKEYEHPYMEYKRHYEQTYQFNSNIARLGYPASSVLAS
uniref:Uncharacterized protein n=1 Tax=Ralstonia solanacearum TaxID=305 RepID=A0A0S4WNF7_RALSL|nr:protein of unknown function [Ralstonia solanacearum]